MNLKHEVLKKARTFFYIEVSEEIITCRKPEENLPVTFRKRFHVRIKIFSRKRGIRVTLRFAKD